ncbi:MAG TPA: hypothetical protein ENJ41_08640 [Oceanospirillales bacterium]|nr:hypothetical protein [Oceanospirillales bacterium]
MRNFQYRDSTNPINNFHSCHFGADKHLKKDYKIELVSKASPIREKVEKFIHDSFEKHFSAQLNTFFPLILSVIRKSDDTLIGALGIRYAQDEKLFSECYLDKSIEESIFSNEHKTITRNKIIELGNFVVRKNTDVKTVIPFVGKFIKALNVEWAVYTLTRPIRSHFQKLDIKLCYLSEANIEAVNGAATNWGNYYNFKPAVYYSNVQDSMNNS